MLQVYAAYSEVMGFIVHVYYVECVLKIIGMGKHYFTDTWCQLDFFLVVLAALDEFASALLASMGGEGSSEVLRVLRILRILRVLRLLKGAAELKKLILTILLCVAPLVNVSALLVLTVFIYAVLGVHLFTFVRHQGQLTDVSNFDTLSNAALLLFQCLTGDGWGVLMMETSIGEETGLCSDAQGNCGSPLAIPYFVSFQIIGAFVFLNLVVAVMIESFTELGKEPDYADDIIEAWQAVTFAPRIAAYIKGLKAAGHADGSLPNIDALARERLRDQYDWDVVAALEGLSISVARRSSELLNNPDFGSDIWTIRTSALRELVLRVPPPVGLRGLAASYADANKLCFKLRVTQLNGRVGFKEVLSELIKGKHTSGGDSFSTPEAIAFADQADDEGGDGGGGDGEGKGRHSSSSSPQTGGGSDAAMAFAMDVIESRIKQKKQGEPSHIDRIEAAAIKRQRTFIARKTASLGIPEHAWETVRTGIFFPVGPRKKAWDAVVMLLILYSVVMVPYRVGFEAQAEGEMWYFEVAVTLFFCADLLATFNCAYLDGDRWIITRSHIAANYLRGWFWIDLPASIPVELILLLVPADGGSDGSNVGNLKMLRGLRMVRMLRLLKLLKLDEYIAALETELRVSLKVLKIVKMVLSLLFLMHLLGCFWFYIALTGGYEVTWISEYDDGSGLDKPVNIQYLYSIYWALMTLTTVGYGDITPTNDLERMYALGSLLIGALVFGYLLSSVGSMMSNLDNRANMVELKLDMTQEVIRHTNLPPALASRIRSYTEFYYSRQSVYDVKEVLGHLTPALERQVKECLLNTSVNMTPLLRVYALPFKLDVMAKLRPVMFEVGEVMLDKGDRTDDLLFLIKGEIRALSSDKSELYSISDCGRFVGEHVLLSRECAVSFTAFTRCELYVVSSTALSALARAQLDEKERSRLASEVVHEVSRKMKLRFLSLRIQLVRLRDAQIHGSKRTCAALAIQTYQIHRLSFPSFYPASSLADILGEATNRSSGSNGGSARAGGRRKRPPLLREMPSGAQSGAQSGASHARAPEVAGGSPATLSASQAIPPPPARAASRAGGGLFSGRGAAEKSPKRSKSEELGFAPSPAAADARGRVSPASSGGSGGAMDTAAEIAAVSRRMADLKQHVARIDEALKKQAEATRQVGEQVGRQGEVTDARLAQLEVLMRRVADSAAGERDQRTLAA